MSNSRTAAPAPSARPGTAVGCALLAWAALALPLRGADGSAALPAAFEKDIQPLLKDHCYKCHGAEKQKGDLNLAVHATGAAAIKAGKVWREVLEQVEAGEMPPKKETPLVPADKAKLVAWIRALRENAPPDPGRVTLRRLNRAEYDNTIRDLIGIDLKPAADFPEDDVGDGFDNIGDVLTIPPLLMEKYLMAADLVLDKALVVEQPNFHFEATEWTALDDGKERAKGAPAAPAADAKPGAKPKAESVVFTGVGEVRGFLSFPVSGKYTIKIKCGADQAGTEPVAIGVKIDDKMVRDAKVMSKNGVVTMTFDVKRGMRPMAIAFLNPFTESPIELPPGPPGQPRPKPRAPRTRGLSIESFDILGPPTPTQPESHRRIMFAKPDAKTPKRDVAKRILERFATRAYRRPVSPEQLDRLLAVYDTADGQGEVFSESLRLALKGVLVSPAFLFRIETDRQGDANRAYKLDSYEIASRLSYFLWSSMPDDALFDAAAKGLLTDPAEIERQVARMLKDAKSRALVDNFASQWLQLRKLEHIQPDAAVFPEFTKELRKDLYDEVAAFFENVMREDRSILEFIDSDYTFINARLAKHYGMSAVPGTGLRKVQLSDSSRGGVMTMGGILAITSMPNRTSPVKRGKWVLEQILGDPPPPPPPMVESLEKQNQGETAKLSLRARLEHHRQDPTCASCHSRLDPIGFGLENFDPIGRWREQDAGHPLDTAGEMPNGQRFKGPLELRRIIGEKKQQFITCLAEKMLTYAIGRGVEDLDTPAIETIVAATEAKEHRFSALVTAIATSYPFLNRKLH